MCLKANLYVCLKIPQTCCMMISLRLPCLLAPAPPTATPSPSFSCILWSQPPSPSLEFSYLGHFAYFHCEKFVSSESSRRWVVQRDHSAETYRSTLKSGIPCIIIIPYNLRKMFLTDKSFPFLVPCLFIKSC